MRPSRPGAPRNWRVYHPHPFEGPDSLTDLDPDEAHHVNRVLRLAVDESISLFDGEGNEWSGVLVRSDRQGVSVRLLEPRTDPVEPDLDVTLYQGLCRADRVEWAVQKATEVGVREIRLVRTARSDAAPVSPRRLGRWRRIAVEAAKQSGRRRVPTLLEIAEPPAAGGGTPGFLLDTSRETPPLAALLAGPAPAAVGLACGPEGGFAEEERRTWIERGWTPVGLGPRTLRTETAGVIAVALVLQAWSDLGGSCG